VVHDYGNIRVSKLVPEQGAWPPGIRRKITEIEVETLIKSRGH